MKNLILITLLAGSLSSRAQSIERQVIGSTGGTATSGSLIVTSTVGETAVATFNSSSLLLTQGYQQGNVANSISVKEIENITEMTLYPNPTTNNSKLEITTNKASRCSVTIFSAQGKLVQDNSVQLAAGVQSSIELDIANQASGIYFVRVAQDNNDAIKTLRLVKQ